MVKVKKKHRKIWIILALLIIVIGVACFAFKPKEIEVVKVETKIAELNFTETGIVTSQESTEVHSLAMGEIKSLNVKEGDVVKKGQIICTIDTSAASAQISSIKAQIEAQYIAISKAESDLAYAQDTLSKMEYLYSQGAISENDYNQSKNAATAAKAGLDAAKAQIKVLQSNIDSAQVSVNNSSIKAPISGYVDEVFVEHTNIISAGQPVVSIISSDDEKSEVEVYVSIKDVDSVQLGQAVEMTLKGRIEDQKIEGTVVKIAEKAESKLSSLGTPEYKVKVSLSYNSELLKEGYNVDCKFIYYRENNKIVLPKSAIWEDSDDIYKVYVKRDATFEAITVQKGIELRDGIVIEKGLEVGDEVAKDCEDIKVK